MKYKPWVFLLVLMVTIINICTDHIVLENCNYNRTAISYYIFTSIFSMEFFIALTSFYPLFITIVLLWIDDRKIEMKIFLLFLGFVGLLNTSLLWVLMNLHLDCIIHPTVTYYSILMLGSVTALTCMILPWLRYRNGRNSNKLFNR